MSRLESKLDQTNRFLLTVIGLIVSAAGTAGLALGTGLLGDSMDQSVSDTLLTLYPPAAPAWAPAVVAASALLLAYLALRWVAAQLRLEPMSHSVEVERDKLGATRVRSSALEHSITADLKHLPGTSDARVRLSEVAKQDLQIRLELTEDSDVAELVALTASALPKAARILGKQDFEASVRLVAVRAKRVN